MELTNKLWSNLEGGYRIPYDASIPLQQLEQTNDPETINNIWAVLWENLHHQGDVGLASYLAVPHLVSICKAKSLFDWNLLGLCCVIEQERHSESNPELPQEYQDYYNRGLQELKEFVLAHINQVSDDTTYTLALATLATCSGRPGLGRLIILAEDKDILEEFLGQY
jgi:hypothetical protein